MHSIKFIHQSENILEQCYVTKFGMKSQEHSTVGIIRVNEEREGFTFGRNVDASICALNEKKWFTWREGFPKKNPGLNNCRLVAIAAPLQRAELKQKLYRFVLKGKGSIKSLQSNRTGYFYCKNNWSLMARTIPELEKLVWIVKLWICVSHFDKYNFIYFISDIEN